MEKALGEELVLKEVKRDGNCYYYYRALAEILKGNQDKYKYYKNELEAFLLN